MGRRAAGGGGRRVRLGDAARWEGARSPARCRICAAGRVHSRGRRRRRRRESRRGGSGRARAARPKDSCAARAPPAQPPSAPAALPRCCREGWRAYIACAPRSSITRGRSSSHTARRWRKRFSCEVTCQRRSISYGRHAAGSALTLVLPSAAHCCCDGPAHRKPYCEAGRGGGDGGEEWMGPAGSTASSESGGGRTGFTSIARRLMTMSAALAAPVRHDMRRIVIVAIGRAARREDSARGLGARALNGSSRSPRSSRSRATAATPAMDARIRAAALLGDLSGSSRIETSKLEDLWPLAALGRNAPAF